MDFIKAISKPSYWFTHQNPVPEFWLFFLLSIFLLVVVTGLVFTILSTKKKYARPLRTFFGKIAGWAWFFGVAGLALLFFSVQRISFISARFLYLIWLAGAIWWGWAIVKYAMHDLPKRMNERKEREEREKYLPKAKK